MLFRSIVIDFPTHDSDGNEIDYNGLFESAPGAMWMLPEDASIGELGQTDTNDILAAVRADIQDFAAVTRTPMHYLNSGVQTRALRGRHFPVRAWCSRLRTALPGQPLAGPK